MKVLEARIASSHLDLHRDKLTVEALESLVSQINAQYIPVNMEHDPRIPPAGRFVSACLERLEDGEYAVLGTAEVFEDGDCIPIGDPSRTMPIREVSDSLLHLIDDRSFSSPRDQAQLEDIRNLLGAMKETDEKKALDPTSVLIVAGALATPFAAGFLGKAGSDTWDAVRNKLAAIINKKRQERGECLLVFRQNLVHDGEPVLVETILTNASEADIDQYFATGLLHLDQIVPRLLTHHKGLRRIVFEFSSGTLTLTFGVRRDAVPMNIKLDTDKK